MAAADLVIDGTTAGIGAARVAGQLKEEVNVR